MSKGVWLFKPTENKAEKLKSAYEFARQHGATVRQAVCFSAYQQEIINQTGRGGLDEIFERIIKGTYQYRCERCKNTENYVKMFMDHLNWLTPSLGEELRIRRCMEFGMDRGMPWQILADYVEDLGFAEVAYELRLLHGGLRRVEEERSGGWPGPFEGMKTNEQ
jgi:hypothetical protein